MDFTNTIPKVYYESPSYQGCPSPSEMKPSSHKKKDSVDIIKSPENFTLDKKRISKWWNNPNHYLKRAWYVDKYTKRLETLIQRQMVKRHEEIQDRN